VAARCLPRHSPPLRCPIDRQEFRATQLKDVRLNFAMVDLLRRCAEREEYARLAAVAQPKTARAHLQPCENECGAPAELYCKVCSAHFCSKCRIETHSVPLMKKHTVVPIGAKSAPSPQCAEHRTEITLYCEECEVRSRMQRGVQSSP
jgi:hypothetical protein